MLTTARADLLVAPVQVGGSGFDRSTRSRMTADLSSAFEIDQSKTLLDSRIVERALGEGRRRIDVNEIRALADHVRASRLITVEVGHDGLKTLRVTVRWTERANASEKWSSEQTHELSLPLSSDRSAAEVFRVNAIPHIAIATGWKARKNSVEPVRSFDDRWPKDLNQLLELAASGAYGEALAYQMLATVAPPRPERVRERLYERSLQALQRLPRDDWHVRWLEANAELNLYSRIVAIKTLGDTENPASVALKARMSGNLGQLESAIGNVPHASFRLMMEVALQDLRIEYDFPIKEKVPTKAISSIRQDGFWRSLFERRFQDLEPWHAQSNVEIKRLLDEMAPVGQYSLESILRGMRVTGDRLDEIALGLTSFDHLDHLRRADERSVHCAVRRTTCVFAALIDLLEGVAVFNGVKGYERVAVVQASDESADAVRRSLQKKFDGQPEFMLAVATAAKRKSARIAPELNAQSDDTSQTNAMIAAHWEMGQSKTARDSLMQIGALSKAAAPFFIEYHDDLPPRQHWWALNPALSSRSPSTDWRPMAQERFLNSINDLNPAFAVFNDALNNPEKRADLAKELAGRFHGHPRRADLLSRLTVNRQEVLTESAKFDAAKRDAPHVWTTYLRYGTHLIEEEGDYKQASEVFLQFPGFRSTSGEFNAVQVSNFANDAASLLYWRGATDEARPLYQIAVTLNTGSDANMLSQSRLDIIMMRYHDAMLATKERALRYDTPQAYREYLQWLFVFGERQNAWAGFERLYLRQTPPEVWYSAAVGMRKQSLSWPQTKNWLLDERRRTARVGGHMPALIIGVLQNGVDRVPARDLVDTLRFIEGEPTARVSRAGVQVLNRSGELYQLRSSILLTNPKRPDTPERIPSHLIYFAEAYASLRQADFAKARELFEKMATYYPVESGAGFGNEYTNFSYALSHFAIAAAKSGDPGSVERRLRSRRVFEIGAAERSDHHLALAVFSALRGDHDEARAALRRAFNVRPLTGQRPIFTEYQWADVCEWLYLETKNVQYRDLVLPWLKSHQRIQPFHAWAYAMEARLTTSENDRMRALGIALYLDPLSERANAFSALLKAQAIESVIATNPFRRIIAAKGG